MSFRYRQSLHRRKLMAACCVCYLQRANVFVATYHLLEGGRRRKRIKWSCLVSANRPHWNKGERYCNWLVRSGMELTRTRMLPKYSFNKLQVTINWVSLWTRFILCTILINSSPLTPPCPIMITPLLNKFHRKRRILGNFDKSLTNW